MSLAAAPDVPTSAVVTGGASGLGRAFCRVLASEGVHVIIADVAEERGRALERELAGSPGGARFVATDVRVYDEVAAAVAAATDGRRLEWMINNAGVGVIGEARDMDVRHWRRVLDVNVLGVAHGVQAAFPLLAAQGSGHVVNVASVAGLLPTPTGAAYCASKHAVVGLSMALRQEAAALGVSVTAACPSFIRTSFGESAEYLRVDRGRIFPQSAESEELQARLARHVVAAARRGRAIVIWPAWMRIAWWAWRLAPWACERLVGPLIMKRHRAARS